METLFPFPSDLSHSVRLIHTRFARTEKGWVYPNHRHSYFEFLHCVEGDIRQWVNGRDTRLLKGDSIMIPANAQHHTETPEGSIYFDFHFDVEEKGLYTIFQQVQDLFIPSGDLLSNGHTVMNRLTRFLDNSSKDALEGSLGHKGPRDELREAIRRFRLQADLTSFLCCLAEYYLLKPTKLDIYRGGTVLPSRLKVAEETAYLLETSVGEKFHIYELAERLSLTRTYISQCFKEVYGMAPSEYQGRIRIRHAKKMLQETDMAMEQIAESLAYSSSGHFGAVFRKIVGVSPRQYRQHLKR
jgi:AraC-like DNA-binding protein